jgi:hypothetical protein
MLTFIVFFNNFIYTEGWPLISIQRFDKYAAYSSKQSSICFISPDAHNNHVDKTLVSIQLHLKLTKSSQSHLELSKHIHFLSLLYLKGG